MLKVALGGGSLFFAGVALFSGGEAFWAASALLGAIWAWVTFFVEDVGQPLGRWMKTWFYGSAYETPGLSLEDNVRLLENRLRDPATPRRIQINAAMRLEEIYRLNKADPESGAAIIELIRQRFPDAPELKQYK